jgi:hypothetical protein
MSTMKLGAHAIRNLLEPLPVDDARVRRRPGDDELRLVLVRETLGGVVVDELALRIEAVGDDVEPLARLVDRRAVRQVAAVRQAHAEHGVAGLERGEEDGLVRLRARMRLDVRHAGTEKLLRPVDRELLGDVDVLAAAVVALARVALGVLVGELRPLRREHGRARVVLRRDELDVRFLPPVLGDDGRPQVGIRLGERLLAIEHWGLPRGAATGDSSIGACPPSGTRAPPHRRAAL